MPRDAMTAVRSRACQELGRVRCQWMAGPTYYLAQFTAVLAREISAAASLSLGEGRFKVYKLMFSC